MKCLIVYGTIVLYNIVLSMKQKVMIIYVDMIEIFLS